MNLDNIYIGRDKHSVIDSEYRNCQDLYLYCLPNCMIKTRNIHHRFPKCPLVSFPKPLIRLIVRVQLSFSVIISMQLVAHRKTAALP